MNFSVCQDAPAPVASPLCAIMRARCPRSSPLLSAAADSEPTDPTTSGSSTRGTAAGGTSSSSWPAVLGPEGYASAGAAIDSGYATGPYAVTLTGGELLIAQTLPEIQRRRPPLPRRRGQHRLCVRPAVTAPAQRIMQTVCLIRPIGPRSV